MDDRGAERLHAHKSGYSCVVVSTPKNVSENIFLAQNVAAIMTTFFLFLFQVPPCLTDWLKVTKWTLVKDYNEDTSGFIKGQ